MKYMKTDGKDYKNILRVHYDIYPKVLERINIGQNEKILDAGCGEGNLGKELLKKGYSNIFGFDYSLDGVEKAKKYYKECVMADIYSLPYEDNQFDTVICIEVFEYLDNPEKAFRELLRVAKKQIIIASANYTWFKIRAIVNNNYKINIRKRKTQTTHVFLKKLGRKHNLKCRFKTVSFRYDKIRRFFGVLCSSDIIAIYKLETFS
ncbi:MAG: class I SAM-dependent methyltransferase [Deltaproteobacteria bacterium]|nr:class I SAM-dependent methyltransferase [Deltaproteobacteria bacterium]